ncbi:MAG TPA: hypothetical protein VMT16_07790, partial [Thermoanaerobaculia bacterium]|nr:hypothetical protein [Thermoanaerobaculia bacterium]
RLRDQVGKIAEMRLGELTRGELEGYLRRMAEEDLSEVDDTRLGPSGEWVEQCTLRLHLLEGEPRELRYSRYDSLPLALSRLTTMAEELAPRTLARGGYALPAGYRPQPGDLLRRADGVLFEVVAFTSDGKGVELQGVDQPLTVFARPEELPQQFVDLVSSRGP